MKVTATGELPAALVGVLDWVLGGMVGVAVVVMNGMVVGGRKLIDMATNKQHMCSACGKCRVPWPYGVLIFIVY